MTAMLQEEVEYTEEMREAFQQFGKYANFGRALPNVLDGLKPIHRRIIWAMWQMRAGPAHYRVKAARAVGEVTGKYHPHGTSAAYGAMVAMAQPFNRRVPLVDGQGNWGSISFDAAAERYTECRLTEASAALLGILPGSDSSVPEVDEDTVDMEANYSGEFTEPVLLPALWPAFVVNGYEGIGVGVAGRAASHNLSEVMDLAIHMVDSPNPRASKVLEKLPGPDLPCDCDVYDTDYGGIQEYITTGHGGFVMRARYELEQYSLGKGKTGTRIVFTGLPFRVSPEMVVEGVTKMLEGEQLPAGIEIINATSKHGLKIVVDAKALDVDDVLQRLFYHSRTSGLQQTFSVSMNAVVDGAIQTVGVVDSLRHWIHHRRTVVRRRSRHRLSKAQARLHVVEGFLLAIPIANEIVDLVRASANRQEASESMQSRWGFTEIQASAVLDMTIGRLTQLGVGQFEEERDKLNAIIEKCSLLLGDQSALNTELKKEMRAVSKRFSSPRSTTLMEGSPVVSRPDTPAVEAPVEKGYLAITAKRWVRWVKREGITRQTDSDYVVSMVPVTSMNRLDAISDWGYHSRISAADVPQKSLVNSQALFAHLLDQGESIVMLGSAAPLGSGTDIVMVTQSGRLKRIPWDSWSAHRENRPYQVASLDDGDPISKALFLPEGSDIALITAYGRMLRLGEPDLTPKGDKAKAVAGLSLEDTGDGPSDRIVWAGAVTESDWVAYWTTEDQVGWFNVGDVAHSGRGSKGRTITRSDFLVSGALVCNTDELSWYHGSMGSPRSLGLEGQSIGPSLSDRQLRLRAEGIRKATAVWPSAPG